MDIKNEYIKEINYNIYEECEEGITDSNCINFMNNKFEKISRTKNNDVEEIFNQFETFPEKECLVSKVGDIYALDGQCSKYEKDELLQNLGKWVSLESTELNFDNTKKLKISIRFYATKFHKNNIFW